MLNDARDLFVTVANALQFMPASATALLVLLLAAALALVLHEILAWLARRILSRDGSYLQTFLRQTGGLTRLALLLVALGLALPAAPLSAGASALVGHTLLLMTIVLLGWLALTALNIASEIYLRRFTLDVADNVTARKHVTQVRILRRAVATLVVIITAGVALMTFDAVREFGVSLFASAGVAGIVAGLAARPLLTNLIAGVQLAITQPIRLDDTVTVENEFGFVEEITSTYVVIRIWDLRRMVVPLTYFIEKPFLNWTRDGSALLGSVTLFLDYTAPIERIRGKAKEIASQSKLWNGQVFNVQVTDAKPDAIAVRVLVSVDSAGAASDLGADLREKLIQFLQQEHPHALPRRRNEILTGDIDPLSRLPSASDRRADGAPGTR
jgi:small-conductance mechanosensitive channel